MHQYDAYQISTNCATFGRVIDGFRKFSRPFYGGGQYSSAYLSELVVRPTADLQYMLNIGAAMCSPRVVTSFRNQKTI